MDTAINISTPSNKLFKHKNGKLVQIKERNFDREKEIQEIIQKNLEIVFNLKLVAKEFTVGKNRLDTLGFDEDSSSFVIIEYKNKKSDGVLEQGLAYRSCMKDNFAKFILAYQKAIDASLQEDDVDQSGSRVILVAPSFNDHQIQAAREIDIELWEVHRYDDEIIQFVPVIPKSKTHTKSPKISRGRNMESSQEITIHTEDDYLEHNASEKTKKLYRALRYRIFSLDYKMSVKPTKIYVAFRTGRRVIHVHTRLRIVYVTLDIKLNEIPQEQRTPNMREKAAMIHVP